MEIKANEIIWDDDSYIEVCGESNGPCAYAAMEGFLKLAEKHDAGEHVPVELLDFSRALEIALYHNIAGCRNLDNDVLLVKSVTDPSLHDQVAAILDPFFVPIREAAQEYWARMETPWTDREYQRFLMACITFVNEGDFTGYIYYDEMYLHSRRIILNF